MSTPVLLRGQVYEDGLTVQARFSEPVTFVSTDPVLTTKNPVAIQSYSYDGLHVMMELDVPIVRDETVTMLVAAGSFTDGASSVAETTITLDNKSDVRPVKPSGDGAIKEDRSPRDWNRLGEYRRLLPRTGFVRKPVVAPEAPDPEPGQRDVFTGSDMTLLGGWRVPVYNLYPGQSFAFSVAGFAADIAGSRFWINHHVFNQETIELSFGAMGSGADPLLWPELSVVQSLGHIQSDKWDNDPARNAAGLSNEFWNSGGLYYDQPNNRLYSTGRSSYSTTTEVVDFVSYIDLGTMIVTDVTSPANWECQRFGGGFVIPPSDYNDEGVMLGRGGYESGQGSSTNPSLITFTGQEIMGSGFGIPKSERERRDDNISGSIFGDNYDPVSGQSWWVTEDVRSASWIQTDNVEGLVYFTKQPSGTLNYSLQNDTLSDGVQHIMQIYDRSQLDDLYTGSITPTNARGTWSSYTPAGNNGQVIGSWFDFSTDILYLLEKEVWDGGEIQPAVFAYQIR